LDWKKIKNIESEWFSCLHKAESKKTYYLIDLDDKSKIKEVEDFFNNINKYQKKYNMVYREDISKNEIKLKQETVNGYHLLINPFNVWLFMRFIKDNKIDAEVKKNELLFLWSSR